MPDHSHPPIISLKLEAERTRNLMWERIASQRGVAAMAAATFLTTAVIVALVQLARHEAALEMLARV